jgi:zinc transporter, ZIP family
VFLGSCVSLLGTMIGASLGVLFKNPSRRLLGAMLGFAGGLMLSVVVFDLIPEAVGKWCFSGTLLYCTMGMLLIMVLDYFLEKIKLTDSKNKKMALLAALALMLHNFPEGMIMGCGFVAGEGLGLKMAFIIAIHDIPEGVAVAAPLIAGQESKKRTLFYAFITAFPTAIGACLGATMGSISPKVLGISLSIASGIMLYVVCGEMIPESSKLWDGLTSTLGTLLGFMIGLIIANGF